VHAVDAGRGGGEAVRTRDHLASVRTFLAFQRAGIALLVIGLAIDKLGLVVAANHGAPLPLTRAEERTFAVIVALAGLVIIVTSFVRLLLQRRVIEGARLRSYALADIGLIGLIAVTGAVIAAYLARIGR
jgi:uncharacterized membrane protein YidH (DUF202 family)